MKERKPRKSQTPETYSSAEKEKSYSPEKNILSAKIFAFMTKHKFFILISVLLICFLPKIFSAENAVGMRALVSGIGIDRTDDKYKITAQIFIPNKNESTAHKKKIVSVTMDSIAEIEDKLTQRVGRVTTLYHCDLVIVGSTILDFGCLPALGYLTENSLISYGAILQATGDSAEDAITGINELEELSSFSWKTFLNDSKKSIKNANIDLLTFINNSRTKGKSSYLTVVNMIEKETKTKPADKGETDAATENAPATEKEIDENIKLFLVKDGKFTGELNLEEAAGLSWLDSKSKQNIIRLKLDKEKNSDEFPIEIKDKKIKTKYFFEDNIPCLKINFKINIKQTDIYNEKQNDISNEENEKIKKQLIDSLQQKVENDIKLTLSKCAEYQSDCLNIAANLHRYNARKFNKYIETQSEISILDNLKLLISVDITATDNARLLAQ